jgi:hypothetical protein
VLYDQSWPPHVSQIHAQSVARTSSSDSEQNSAELNSLYLRGVCGKFCYVEDYAWVDGKRSARNGAMRGSTSPIRISRASRRPISGPSVTPLCVTAS